MSMYIDSTVVLTFLFLFYIGSKLWDIAGQETSQPTNNNQNDSKTSPALIKETLLNDYKDCFEGLGTFRNMKPYHITLEPTAEPAIHPPRSVPVHLRDVYKQEIDEMLELGVIAPVNKATDWVNSIVLSETTNEKSKAKSNCNYHN
ncbi:hypothetical protein QZH41_015493 [Actinostola sp. cb2023]|nr:hypothetical protein QZH41_015493 [Actinostola sp. cb2023]